MTPEDLDRAEGVLIDLVRCGVKFAPPPYNTMLSLVLPLIESFVRHQVAQVKTGIADGSIISDGRGGFVPNTNSRFNPKTGKFL